MQITCEQCQSKFNIADEKIPEGKVSTLRCPKCKSTITIDTTKKPEPPAPPLFEEALDSPQEALDDYNADEKPFDFINKGTGSSADEFAERLYQVVFQLLAEQ